MDDAEKILSQRWHPIQDLLTEGGFKLREAWVGIVEAVAAAFETFLKLELASWKGDRGTAILCDEHDTEFT